VIIEELLYNEDENEEVSLEIDKDTAEVILIGKLTNKEVVDLKTTLDNRDSKIMLQLIRIKYT